MRANAADESLLGRTPIIPTPKSRYKWLAQRAIRNGMQIDDHLISEGRRASGNALIYFCVFGMVFSSAFKFLHLPKAVAYMSSLGYEDGTFFLVAGLELLSAVVFCFRSTRSLGLLLVSSYFGGAISAHLASHSAAAGGPFMIHILNHPHVGILPASLFLASAWIGTWLRHPGVLWSLNKFSDSSALPSSD